MWLSSPQGSAISSGAVQPFLDARDDLAADRAVGIVRVDQVEEMRGDRHRELGAGQQHAGAFLGGEFDPLLELGERLDAVLQLPLRILPMAERLLRPVAGGVGEEFRG